MVCIETFCFHHASPLFSLSSFLVWTTFSLPSTLWQVQSTYLFIRSYMALGITSKSIALGKACVWFSLHDKDKRSGADFFCAVWQSRLCFLLPGFSSSLSLKVQTVTLNVLAASNFPHERYRSNQVFQGSPGFSLFSKKTSMFLFRCPVLMENHSSGALTSPVMS